MLEKDFEKQIERIAPLLGCKYFKIPDTKMLNAGNRYQNREQKRPFDAVLVTPNDVLIIECKIKSGQLKPHQIVNIATSNRINSHSAYVLRKYDKYIRIDYHTDNGKTSEKVGDIKEMIEYFRNNLHTK